MKALPLPQGSVSWLGVPSPLGFARRKAQTHQTTHGGPDAELSRYVSDTNQSRRSGALPHRFSGTQETPAKALSLLLIRVWDSEKNCAVSQTTFNVAFDSDSSWGAEKDHVPSAEKHPWSFAPDAFTFWLSVFVDLVPNSFAQSRAFLADIESRRMRRHLALRAMVNLPCHTFCADVARDAERPFVERRSSSQSQRSTAETCLPCRRERSATRGTTLLRGTRMRQNRPRTPATHDPLAVWMALGHDAKRVAYILLLKRWFLETDHAQTVHAASQAGVLQ